MGDRSGQGEDMEQSRDASWRQWPMPAAEVSGVCTGDQGI